MFIICLATIVDKLQSVDSIFQIIRVLVNLSGDFLNTVTFTGTVVLLMII